MGYHIEIVGRDKEQLKQRLRESVATLQNPHNPDMEMVERVCKHIDNAQPPANCSVYVKLYGSHYSECFDLGFGVGNESVEVRNVEAV